MNAAPHSEEIAAFAAVAQDLWAAGDGDPHAVTLSASTPVAPLEATRQIDRRIDDIFVRPGRPASPLTVQRSYLAGNQKVEGMYPSDHFATVSDLEI